MTLSVAAVAEALGSVVASFAVDWTWPETLVAFVPTNAAMGLSFAACGGLIAWHRPGNPVGWLLIVDGLGHATTALAAPLLVELSHADAPLTVQRLVATAFSYSWPWSIGLWLPLTLLLLPDGRLPSRRWRWVVAAVCATAPLFVLENGAAPTSFQTGLPVGYLTIDGYDRLTPLWFVSELRTLAVLLLGLAALVVRYRRGDDRTRQQLLWILLAGVVVVATTAGWALVQGTPIGVLFAIPLVPLAITAAVLRHGLLDIRLVVSRTLLYLSLSTAVFAAYVGLVTLLDGLFAARTGTGVLAALVVAVAFGPARSRLQRALDRALYGERHNAEQTVSRVTEQLTTGVRPGVPGVLHALTESLRMPYAAVHIADEPVATCGSRPAVTEILPLAYEGQVIGQLVVGLRRGESGLSEQDRRLLILVSAPLAVAVHAGLLTEQLQESRELLVSAREEERRRLRRELHEGLGPTLTGAAMSADAAFNLTDRDPEEARRLLQGLRGELGGAIDDIRRLVYGLRPPALDDLGLVGALGQRIEQMSRRADGSKLAIQLETGTLPELPAAVEVAAYRIVTEALANAVRHSQAMHIEVRLWCDASLHVCVDNDGPPSGGSWRPGVGLSAMAERARELGGTCTGAPTRSGGRVRAELPLGSR